MPQLFPNCICPDYTQSVPQVTFCPSCSPSVFSKLKVKLCLKYFFCLDCARLPNCQGKGFHRIESNTFSSGAIKAIHRLQDIYKIKAGHFSRGDPLGRYCYLHPVTMTVHSFRVFTYWETHETTS